jgi:ribosomal protein L18
MTVLTKPQRRLKRRRRVRAKVRGTAERPRLSIFRSNRGMFVQLIDDTNGRAALTANSSFCTSSVPSFSRKPSARSQTRIASAYCVKSFQHTPTLNSTRGFLLSS